MKCKHDWRLMSWQEAYPASSGRVCKKCDLYELGWFGHDVSKPATPGPREMVEGDL